MGAGAATLASKLRRRGRWFSSAVWAGGINDGGVAGRGGNVGHVSREVQGDDTCEADKLRLLRAKEVAGGRL